MFLIPKKIKNFYLDLINVVNKKKLCLDKIQTTDKQLPVIWSEIKLGSHRPNHLTLGNEPPEIQG